MKKPKFDPSITVYEMRAYMLEDGGYYLVVGYICIEDGCEVENIYEDYRLPACGSNWSLVESEHKALKGTTVDKYFVGDTPECIEVLPEHYMRVYHNQSGESWIVPITGRQLIDPDVRFKKWLRDEFGGELKVDGKRSQFQAEYSVTIHLDYQHYDGVCCWTSGEYYVKCTRAY